MKDDIYQLCRSDGKLNHWIDLYVFEFLVTVKHHKASLVFPSVFSLYSELHRSIMLYIDSIWIQFKCSLIEFPDWIDFPNWPHWSIPQIELDSSHWSDNSENQIKLDQVLLLHFIFTFKNADSLSEGMSINRIGASE